MLGQLYTSYSVLEGLISLIFYNPCNRLIELSLITNDGLILSKHLPPNRNLRELTVVLHDMNDLYVLLDGLMPNLVNLNVTVSESAMNALVQLPHYWPNQPMFHLERFQ